MTTRTASIETAKLLFNSVISTPNGRFMTMDVKDFYLNTIMVRFEYLKIPIDLIPEEIIIQYNLREYEHDGFVLFEVQKGMYGLPQAGRIANDQLKEHLEKDGYVPMTLTPGLWKHKTRPIVFALWVDDFGVMYVDIKDALHLKTSLEKKYKVSTEWSGNKYVGLTLAWD